MKKIILAFVCITLNACAYVGPDGSQMVVFPPAPVGAAAVGGFGGFGGGVPFNGSWFGISPYGTGGVYGGGTYPIYGCGTFPY